MCRDWGGKLWKGLANYEKRADIVGNQKRADRVDALLR